MKLYPSNFNVAFITYSCDGAAMRCVCVCAVQPVIIHITYHFHFNCTRPREGGLISIILIIHKSKYSRFSNYLLERSLLSVG